MKTIMVKTPLAATQPVAKRIPIYAVLHLSHFLLLLLAVSGCSNEVDSPDAPLGTDREITLTAELPGDDPQTRIGYQDPTEGAVTLTWSADDAFTAYSLDADIQITGVSHFGLATGAGTNTATFTGTLPDGTPSDGSFRLFYPAARTVKQDGTLVALLAGQMQTDNNSMAHLAAYNFMGATATDPTQPILFRHLLAMMRFDITLTGYDATRDGAPQLLSLSLRTPDPAHPLSEQIALTGNTPLTDSNGLQLLLNGLQLLLNDVQPSADGKLRAYLMMPPMTVAAGNALVVSVTCANGTVYRYTATDATDPKEYQAGMRYRAAIDMEPAADGVSVMTDETETSESLSGSGTATDPYLISSAGDLLYFDSQVALGFSYWNKYVRLTTDLKIDTENFMGIGDADRFFCGHFDGGGHTVGGTITSSENYSGFFCYTSQAVVHNLHMAVKLTSTGCSYKTFATGALIGNMMGGQLLHCSNSGDVSAMATNSSAMVGGLVGWLSNGKLVGCINRGAILKGTIENPNNVSYNGIGGIVGRIDTNASLHNCFNYGDIASGDKPIKDVNMGGIVGRLTLSEPETFITLTHCVNYGTLTAATNTSLCSYAGGLIGYGGLFFNNNQLFSMHNCINHGEVTTATTAGDSSNAASGGLIGCWWDNSDSEVKCIYNCCSNMGSGQTNPIGRSRYDFNPFTPCLDGHTPP